MGARNLGTGESKNSDLGGNKTNQSIDWIKKQKKPPKMKLRRG
jgi:hypothetical protein